MAVAAERDIFIFRLEMCFAVRAHREVGVVAGVMTFRILQSVFPGIGIEVASGGLEVGGFALRVLMKVDGVFTGRQILDIDFHPDPRGRFPQNRAAHDLALSILELNQHLGRTSRYERDHEQYEREQASGFHGWIIAKTKAVATCGKTSCAPRATRCRQPVCSKFVGRNPWLSNTELDRYRITASGAERGAM